MTVVLGIDAAWTEKQPSGVAPSYEAFMALPDGIPVEWQSGRFLGCIPDVRALLEADNRLARSPVDIVTVDMPIASGPITGRRLADNCISR